MTLRCKYNVLMSNHLVFAIPCSLTFVVPVLQVWALAVGKNLSYAHSNA